MEKEYKEKIQAQEKIIEKLTELVLNTNSKLEDMKRVKDNA